MFKKLRLKFIILASSITFLVLFVVALILNLSLFFTSDGKLLNSAKIAYSSPINNTDNISLNGNDKDEKILTRYFFITKSGDSYTFEGNSPFPFNENEFQKIAVDVFNNNSNNGFYDYLYFYKNENKAVFLDARSEKEALVSTLIYSSSISFAAFLGITVFVSILSKKVIKPYEDLYYTERRFLTDASHELKTPLAVVSANLEILEKTNKDNVWITSSLKEISKTKQLIADMISLNKIEEMQKDIKREIFDFSLDFEEACDFYEGIAEKKNVVFDRDIVSDIKYNGNEEMILKLISILLDNAFKFVNEQGNINAKLSEDKRKITLSITNSVNNVDEEKLSHCFERFYTMDESHSHQNGGFGIGLSIAKAIVDKHNGTIKAIANEDKKSVVFEICLKK